VGGRLKAAVLWGILGSVLLFFAASGASRLACAFLLGELRTSGRVTTPRGVEEALLEGSIVLEFPEKAGPFLAQLNLIVPRGVRTPKGPSGVIGLSLLDPPVTVWYDEKTGEVYAEFKAELHYPLIDRVKGFRKVQEGGCLQVFSYTEAMEGVLKGRIRGDLRRGKEVSLEGTLSFSLSRSVLGQVKAMEVPLRALALFCGTQWVDFLKIQPVFIRAGGKTSGWSFPALMDGAREIWGRCGGVRCIAFEVLPPRYVNDPDYWVIDDWDEGYALMDEVEVPDAVEVFVVGEFSKELTFGIGMLGTGGGWCSSSGTASAKVITSDLQLDVPCDWCSPCGDVNYYHLAHELGHALGLCHPTGSCPSWRPRGSDDSVMEPSGFCADNPDVQSAHNCREAINPLLRASLYIGKRACTGSPDIRD